jgi:hypothetical protein
VVPSRTTMPVPPAGYLTFGAVYEISSSANNRITKFITFYRDTYR